MFAPIHLLSLTILGGLMQQPLSFADKIQATASPSLTQRDATEEIDFDTQVMPLLTKSGCNSGACHGAAAGRGNLHLSLFGSDPESDFDSLVLSFEGRRVNLSKPEQSLVLLKPTEQLSHGGGNALNEASTDLLERWIAQGARRRQSRSLVNLSIEPEHSVVELEQIVQLKIQASFSDGSTQDVSLWTTLSTYDATAVTIDQASITVHRSGQHTVIARFLDRVVPIQISVPFTSAAKDWVSQPAVNFIDRHIDRTLTKLHISPSPAASDSVWLRRVTLALTGKLPNYETTIEFQSGNDSDKRLKVVNALLDSQEFTDYWTFRTSKLLQIHSLPDEPQAFATYVQWLRNQIASKMGWDKIVQQLILAEGDSHTSGPANFSRMVKDARGQAELVAQSFAGIQLACANCHNHPLDRWTQDDYHGLAAVFSKLDRDRFVRVVNRGGVTNPRTGQPAVERIPGQSDLLDQSDHRLEVVQWLTNPHNNLLARAVVNRLWKAMFGRGLVEPENDLRLTNPATHPELLQQLADDFVEHHYDMRHTLRLIALSGTFGRSGKVLPGNSSDEQFYSRAYSHRLEPEVLVDAICDVTDSNESYASPEIHFAIQMLDPAKSSTSLDLLGRCRRVNGCGNSPNHSTGLASQLHLLNGELVNKKISSPTGRLHRLIATGKTPTEVVQEFCIRALNRQPSSDELDRWQTILSTSDPDDQKHLLEDFLWALLNSREFSHND